MIGPKKNAATEAHKADLDALYAMQLACMRGEVTEDVYNAHRDAEAKRLIALGVQWGAIYAKIIKGQPTL